MIRTGFYFRVMVAVLAALLASCLAQSDGLGEQEAHNAGAHNAEAQSVDAQGGGGVSTGDWGVWGIDVSHYQGAVAWPEVKRAGAAFTYIKLTEGLHTNDAQSQANWQGSTNAEIVPGGYHFFVASEDAGAQADHFLGVLAQARADGATMLPPVLDVETANGEPDAHIIAGATQWLERVSEALGCTPLVYTSVSFADDHIGHSLSTYPLWLAHYAAEPSLPSGWTRWVFWQRSQDGTVRGIDGTVDLNVFNGDHAALTNLTCRLRGGVK